uniref:Uncharacterized protein n=1 Tax=Caenorhabditis japonica TaxID=281687 RepID=A0A8R1EEP4_CAEJA
MSIQDQSGQPPPPHHLRLSPIHAHSGPSNRYPASPSPPCCVRPLRRRHLDRTLSCRRLLTDHAERRFLYSDSRGTFWKDRICPSTDKMIKGGHSMHSRCDFLAFNFVFSTCMLAAVALTLS